MYVGLELFAGLFKHPSLLYIVGGDLYCRHKHLAAYSSNPYDTSL